MNEHDRVDRRLNWLRNHRTFSWLIAAGAVVVLLTPLFQAGAGVWGFFADRPADLEVIHARNVTDPREVARLLQETLPGLADSTQLTMVSQADPVVIGPRSHSAIAPDYGQTRWVRNFSLFPELALLDVVLRNTAQHSAVVSRIDVEAELIGPSSNVYACLPLRMSAAYHVLLTGDRKHQIVKARVAHRIGGNDAERIGILVGQRGASGRYRLRAVLMYNRTQQLRFPPIEVDLGQGCGQLYGRLRKPLRLPDPDY